MTDPPGPDPDRGIATRAPFDHRARLDGVAAALVLLLLVALATLTAAPSTLPPQVIELVESVERSVSFGRLSIGLAVLVVAYAGWRVYTARQTTVTDETFVDRRQESPQRSVTTAGAGTTTLVERTSRALRENRPASPEAVRAELRRTLLAVETARGDPDPVVADRIDTGEWTDDATAAIFLGEAAAGTEPFWRRVWAWLFPELAFERRVERSLAAIECRADSLEGATFGGAAEPSSEPATASVDGPPTASVDGREEAPVDGQVASSVDGRKVASVDGPSGGDDA